MSKQNRGLMTNQTKQTKDYMTQEDHEAYEQELEKIDMDSMIFQIAKNYKEIHHGDTRTAIFYLLNELCEYGEGEGVLVKTAIKQLWQANEDQKEGV